MPVQIELSKDFRFLFEPKRYKVAYGGRGSSKSWSFARALLITIASSTVPMRVLCTREFQNSIDDSVHRLLADQIRALGMDDKFIVKQHEILCVNGSMVLFEGLHRNVHKIKSLEGIDICWVEEATKVSQDSWDLLIPTIRKEKSEIWITFNPDQEDDPVYKMFVLGNRDDVVLAKVNHERNPFFPEVLRKEMEWVRSTDPDKYLHVWEGKCRSQSEAQVLYGKWRIDRFEVPNDGKGGVAVPLYFGADWGFSQDPTTLIRCYIHEDSLWIDYEAYGVGVDIVDTPAMFDAVPGVRDYMITADSARPETIHHMQNHGFRMRGAHKGKDSVKDGVSFLRSFKEIVIHERCKHTIDECKYYSYKVDPRTDDILPELEDKHNHCIDALRYAVERVMLAYGRPKVTATSRIW